MIAKRVVLFVLAAILAGCASGNYEVPIKVTSQFNPEGAYGTYKTWNFTNYTRMPEEGVLSDAAFRLQLANMIEAALKQYGLVRVFQNPDLDVGYFVAADEITEKQLEKWFDEDDWDMPVYRGEPVNEWKKGSLILLVFESKSGQLLWRSSAEAIIDQSAPEEERRETVKRAVTLMLEKLPREKQE
jgi:hypothetical protein